jgi:hypothetical protein
MRTRSRWRRDVPQHQLLDLLTFWHFRSTADALEVTMPPSMPNPYAYVLRITT